MEYNPLNLSPSEIKVAKLISAGYSSRDIAEDLGIKLRTVEVHRQHIKTRLKAKTIIGIYIYTINHLQEVPNE